MLCNVAKLFSFGVSLDFHHKVCKREGMYRSLEGNDCGNKGKENQCLRVDGWILSFLHLSVSPILWCLPKMWAVFFLIIPTVGPSSPNSDFQYNSSECSPS
nr:hypothetical protein CFP56_51071 [Quercus suber]